MDEDDDNWTLFASFLKNSFIPVRKTGASKIVSNYSKLLMGPGGLGKDPYKTLKPFHVLLQKYVDKK